ncbi:MAG: hypothetical protein O2923_10700 [Verrucomicrobia bacterium]|nr:hypothetical protein [Verrucomicrobiota bacterium]MDA1086493.1 hypothetical protein [Verrucomicrobiota bacterium]
MISCRSRALRSACLVLGALALLAGCSTAKAPLIPTVRARPVGNSPRLAKAELLYSYGDHTGAMGEIIELSREDANMPGLADLRHKVSEEMVTQENRDTGRQVKVSDSRVTSDVEHHKVIPDTYRFRKPVRGETAPLRAAASSVDEVLKTKVSIHLDSADLETFILALGASENVNIIADNNVGQGSSMTLHADKVPLAEILDFASRNLGVTFHIGESLIWATARAATDSSTPLSTRVYKLRKGDPGLALSGGEDAVNDEFSENHSLLLDAIDRFVPQVEGTDFLFNKNAHVLIVKNTKSNHAIIEDLIAALDVTPPQVHIESRFITVRVDSLRELGIDWLLNSPLSLSKKNVLRNNAPAQATRTQFDSGAAIGFPPSVNAAQGLNFTYRGVLTDPMFQAVMHALEVSGKARALSVPRITTMNNHEARIHVGENFLYYDRYTTIDVTERVVQNLSDNDVVVTTQVLVPEGDPKEQELGISLSVIPSVGADMRMITLALNPHIENFVRYETFEVATGSNNGSNSNGATNSTGTSIIRLPIFEESDINTKVVVQSGETVVMGGIITTTELKSESKVPILGDIPFFGRAFRKEEIDKIDENLLIFVTATILSERGEDLVPLAEAVATAPVR